jgi:hypothetical protein
MIQRMLGKVRSYHLTMLVSGEFVTPCEAELVLTIDCIIRDSLARALFWLIQNRTQNEMNSYENVRITPTGDVTVALHTVRLSGFWCFQGN